MAKLGKQKFSLADGHESARTTFSGTIEMYLHYDTDGDFFYFPTDEMKKYFPEDSFDTFYKNTFGSCNTKQKAINVIEMLLAKEVKETRKLRIEIGMNSDLYKIHNPKHKREAGKNDDIRTWSFEQERIVDPTLPKYLQEMLERGGGVYGHGLTLKFERIMEVEVNGIKRYADCDKNWQYKKKSLSGHGANLIDWTPAAEAFLMDTQHRIDELGKVILNFFNAGDKAENLILKMESNVKLLPDGK